MQERPLHRSWVDDVLTAVYRRFWLVAAISLAFGIGFWVLTRFMQPVYRGTTILAPADLEKKSMGSGLGSALGSVSGFAALAGLGLGGNDYATEEALAVLKSQALTEKFIQDNNLLPQLFPKSWDAASGRWKAGKKPPTLGGGFNVFNRLRKVEKDNKSGLITMKVD